MMGISVAFFLQNGVKEKIIIIIQVCLLQKEKMASQWYYMLLADIDINPGSPPHMILWMSTALLNVWNCFTWISASYMESLMKTEHPLEL